MQFCLIPVRGCVKSDVVVESGIRRFERPVFNALGIALATRLCQPPLLTLKTWQHPDGKDTSCRPSPNSFITPWLARQQWLLRV